MIARKRDNAHGRKRPICLDHHLIGTGGLERVGHIFIVKANRQIVPFNSPGIVSITLPREVIQEMVI